MKSSKNIEKLPPIINNDEIDLVALLKHIWAGRLLIFYSIVFCALIGLVIAFTSPAKYKASVVLLSQTESRSNLGQLGGLAALAGINVNAMMGDASSISPELYPNIVGSYPFLKELVNKSYLFPDEQKPLLFYDKVKSDTIVGIGATIKRYTIRLPWTLKAALTKPKAQDAFSSVQQLQDGLVEIDNTLASAMALMHSYILIEVERSGLVKVTAETESPILSAQVAQNTFELLQNYVIAYKTSQVVENLNFIQARFDEKKSEFEEAQQALFAYRDMFRNRVAERTDTRYQELSDRYTLTQSVYQNLAQQLEQARIAVKRETPVFNVIEPVTIPLEKSSPRRALILVVSLFLGGFLGVGLVLGLLIFGNVRRRFLCQ